MADNVGVKMDLKGVFAGLEKLDSVREHLARSMAVAGGKIFRDEAKAFAPVGDGKWYGTSITPGLLKSAIYLAYKDKISSKDRAIYSVTWNSKKAPHGHLAEFGHLQEYRVYQDEDGEWHTDTGAKLANPKWVAGTPFLRPAYESGSAAAQVVMLKRAKERLPELLAGGGHEPAE